MSEDAQPPTASGPDEGGGTASGGEEPPPAEAGQPEPDEQEQPEPAPGPGPDPAADPSPREEAEDRAERPRATGQEADTDAPDSPGSESFQRRDRTTRSQRRAGQQNLSGSARGVGVAYSAVNLGDGGIAADKVYIGDVRPPPPKGPLDRTWLARVLTTFVETPAVKELRTGLEERRVQILQGGEGSGRTTSGVVALDAVQQGKSVIEVLDAETTLSELAELQPDDLREADGYLLDCSADPSERLSLGLLNHLRKVIGDAEAFLVLIVDERAPLDRHDLRDYLVQQVRPDPHDVLCAHLDHLLDGKEPSWPDTLWAEVDRELAAEPTVGEVVDLADTLADAAARELAPDQVAVQLHHRLLARARAKLTRPATERGDDVKGAELLRRQALLLACAVLNELPLTTVTEAAAILAERLYDVETCGEPLPRPVFGGDIASLLRYAEATDRAARKEELAEDPEELTRRVWMRNTAFPAAVLEAAWLDFDVVRQPLLDWLRELTASRDDAVRVRAAIAVGKLAAYDFEHIFQQVIEPWAGSANPNDRWAAAWALEMAAKHERLATPVRAKVRQWCRESLLRRQRTALLALGTAIDVQYAEESLGSLFLLALRPAHARDYALALSVRELFLKGAQESVREALSNWAEQGQQPELRPLAVQAARSLLALSLETGAQDDTGSNDLLRLFVGDPLSGPDSRSEWERTLTRLWKVALTNPSTSGHAWEVLRLWLLRAGRDERLVQPLVQLVEGLAADRRLRNRALFFQQYWPVEKTDQDPIVDHILRAALAGDDGAGRGRSAP
jgi:hypothetical protein